VEKDALQIVREIVANTNIAIIDLDEIRMNTDKKLLETIKHNIEFIGMTFCGENCFYTGEQCKLFGGETPMYGYRPMRREKCKRLIGVNK
jgi:hypothetical protein